MGISSRVEKTALFVGAMNSRTGLCISPAEAVRDTGVSKAASKQIPTVATRFRGDRRPDVPTEVKAWFRIALIGLLKDRLRPCEGESSSFTFITLCLCPGAPLMRPLRE